MTTQKNVILFQSLTEQKARELLSEIVQNSSKIKFSKHAIDRMAERGVTRPQVIRILERGRFDEAPHKVPNGSWEMALVGISAGHDIKVVCSLDNSDINGNYTVIITTYIL